VRTISTNSTNLERGQKVLLEGGTRKPWPLHIATAQNEQLTLFPMTLGKFRNLSGWLSK